MVPSGLQHLTPADFHHPDGMDADFVRWFDTVVQVAGFMPVITSDARTPAENTAASGHAVHSLHLLGRALDLRIRDLTPERQFALLRAILDEEANAPGYLELEIVHGPTDQHFHVGVFPSGQVSASRLILASD